MNTDSEFEGKLTEPQIFCRAELNDLVRDLELSKKTVRIVSFKIERQKLAGNWCHGNILSQKRR